MVAKDIAEPVAETVVCSVYLQFLDSAHPSLLYP